MSVFPPRFHTRFAQICVEEFAPILLIPSDSLVWMDATVSDCFLRTLSRGAEQTGPFRIITAGGDDEGRGRDREGGGGGGGDARFRIRRDIVAFIHKDDPRFDRKAYEFVRLGLDHTVKEADPQEGRRPASRSSRHVTGGELLHGLRVYALDQFGPMAKTILESWGVRRCRDFGDIVFNLIEYKVLSKTDSDRLEDFDGLYDFEEAFVKPCSARRGPAAAPSPEPLRLAPDCAKRPPGVLRPAPARNRSLAGAAVARTVLPNGLTLILKTDRSAALASVQVWVRTGSIHEGANPARRLRSHYLEHMLFKGTSRRAGREISAAVQAHGGNINAYTTFDRTVYYIDLPSEHIGVAVDLLADAVLHSTLPPDEAVKEKDVILREIAITRDDPDDRLWETVLFASAFREHPYRYPIIGYRELFSAVTPRGPRRPITARAMCRTISSWSWSAMSTPRAAATAAVAEHFGSAPRARLAPVLVPAEPRQLAPRRGASPSRTSRSAGRSWPGRSPGWPIRTRPPSICSPWCWATATARSCGRNCGKRPAWCTRSTPPAGIPGTGGLFLRESFTCDADKRAARRERPPWSGRPGPREPPAASPRRTSCKRPFASWSAGEINSRCARP